MERDKERLAVLAAILIAVIGLAVFMFTVIIPHLQAIRSKVANTDVPTVDTSSVQTSEAGQ